MRGGKILFHNLNILIIDDSESMQRLIGSMLEGAVRGRLSMCRDTAAAAEMLEREPFHLLIVDRELTGECGLEFVRQTRTRPGPNRHIPVLVLSVNAFREVVLEALIAGAHSLLRKPLSRRALIGHARRALSEHWVFVPLGSRVVPLKPDIAEQLGDRPSEAEVIAALSAVVYSPAQPGEILFRITAKAEPPRQMPVRSEFVLI
ncbi:MAG: response regulator [Xanthobacteraceae bacterium]|nr:MAG: response regulator [Xanthobacteraceae bacterium]